MELANASPHADAAALYERIAHSNRASARALPQNNARAIEPLMLSLDECMGMSGLSEDELAIVAEHRGVPLIVAAQLGHALLATPKGIFTLRSYMLEALERAKLGRKTEKAKHIDRVLTRFIAEHPVATVVSASAVPDGRTRVR